MYDNNTYCSDMRMYGCVPVFPYVKENVTEALANLFPVPEYIVTSDDWLMKGAGNWQPVAKLHTDGSYGWYFDNSTSQKGFLSVFPLCPNKPDGSTNEIRMLQVPPRQQSSGDSLKDKITLCVALLMLGWINVVVF